MVCGFTEDGQFIFAGSNDCCIYVWHWDLGVDVDPRWKHRGGSNPYAPPEVVEDELEGPSDAGTRCAFLYTNAFSARLPNICCPQSTFPNAAPASCFSRKQKPAFNSLTVKLVKDGYAGWQPELCGCMRRFHQRSAGCRAIAMMCCCSRSVMIAAALPQAPRMAVCG